MTTNEENLQPTTEIIEKEDRPLKRKVDRQAQKIHELTAQVSKLEAEAEKQAEELGSLQDERDDAQDETKQALQDLEHWKRYVAYKRTEFKRLTEALNVSQKEVTQLQNENRLREQTAQIDGKKLCDALTAVYCARISQDAALESLATLFKDTGIYQAPALEHSPFPTVAAIPLVKLPPPPGSDGSGSYSPAPSSSHSKVTPPPGPNRSKSNRPASPSSPSTTAPPQRHYTIEQIKSWNPITTTQRTHGPEIAAAIWKAHPSHHNRTKDANPPDRPVIGFAEAHRLRQPIGTPPTSSFAPTLDNETRQLTQALVNRSFPLASAAARLEVKKWLQRPPRQSSSPVVLDGSM
ncbi:MAG: hypothetical protein Q9208_005490 [Pyrenodesmia sp. 3 TL-2023]